MEWREDFSVHVPGIDQDHRILVARATEIEQAVAEGRGASLVHGAIREFIQLARRHFNREVDWMRIRDYPGIGPHIQDHKAFLAKLGALEAESLAGPLTHEAVAFLPAWFEQHLLSYDKQYASYASAAGKL